MKTATARIHCRPEIKPETQAALIEMMRVALKQFKNYEGPVEVEIIANGDLFYECLEDNSERINN